MSNTHIRACVGLLLALTAGTFAAEPAFTDVTESSGVAAVVTAHYANVPKWWFSGMDLLDLDGDGDLDLHLAGHGHPAAAAINDGKGGFTYVDPKLAVQRGVRHDVDIPYPGGEIRLAYDFNEDGKLDIHCSWHDGGGVLYLNDHKPAGGAWNFKRSHDLDYFSRSQTVADIDRDGIADYLVNAGERDADPKLGVLLGKGDGTFHAPKLIGGFLRGAGAVPVDLDGDGDMDLLVTQRGYNPAKRRILRNDGWPKFTLVPDAGGLGEDGGTIHGAGDFDRDGDLDLICVEGHALAVYLNDGHGKFTRKADGIEGVEKLHPARKPKGSTWGGALTTDIDNDGVPDVLINGKYFVYVLRGLGDGRLRLMNLEWGLPTSATSAVDEGLGFGDIDGDGDLDLLTCGPGPEKKKKGVSLWRNDLPRRKWIRIRPIGRKGNRGAAGAKIRLYAAGHLGEDEYLLWYEQVAIWGRQSFHSYYAPAAVTERHFGLGTREAVDVAVEFYPSGKLVTRRNVPADRTIELREPAPAAKRTNG